MDTMNQARKKGEYVRMVYFLENIILGLKSIYKGEYVRMGYFLENIILGLKSI